MTPDTLGLVESRSIAAGVLLCDRMVKAAQVSLLKAKTICAGRYFIQIAGDRAAVETAVGVAESSDSPLLGSFVISRVHPTLIESVGTCREIPPGDALAVVECRTAVAGILAADQALKKAGVQLARLVTGQGISGKSFFVLNGEMAELEEAVAAACQILGEKLIEAVLLPATDAVVVAALTLRMR
jgi:microcompartment protein CcmL/EutN